MCFEVIQHLVALYEEFYVTRTAHVAFIIIYLNIYNDNSLYNNSKFGNKLYVAFSSVPLHVFFLRETRFVLAPKANIKYLPSTAFVISFFFSCGQSSSASLFDCSKALFVNLSSEIHSPLRRSSVELEIGEFFSPRKSSKAFPSGEKLPLHCDRC